MSGDRDMEFPGQCLTNVHKIDDCTSIRYNVYALHENESNPSPAFSQPPTPYPDTARREPDGRKVAGLSQEVELELRAQGKVVASSAEDTELWWYDIALNRGSNETEGLLDRNLPSGEYITIGRARLKKIREDTFTSSSLDQSKAPLRPVPVSSPAAHPTSSDASSAEAFTQSRERIATAYRLFITAVISTISYSLAKKYRYIPVNFRILLLPSFSKPLGVYDTYNISPRLHHITLVSLDARLTATGTLILSIITDARPELPKWYLFDRDHVGIEDKDLILAPGGKRARFRARPSVKYPASPAYAESPVSGTIWSSGVRQRTRPSLAWRHHVQSWLSWNGLDIPNIDESDSWIEVEINAPRDEVSDNSSQFAGEKTVRIFWPACLCLVIPQSSSWPQNSLSTKLSMGSREGLVSGQETRRASDVADPVIADPLAFAEDWYSKRTEREEIFKQVRAAEEAKEVEAETARLAQQAISSDAPVITGRTGNHADVPSISGIYPTPPDGLLSHSNLKLSLAEKPTGLSVPEENTVKDDDLPTSISHGGDNEQTDENPPTASFDDTQMTGIDNDIGDDLFGDMDDEIFGGNDVTEADFSFFDEPAMDGIETTNSGGDMIQSLHEPDMNAGPDRQLDLAPDLPIDSTRKILDDGHATASSDIDQDLEKKKKKLAPDTDTIDTAMVDEVAGPMKREETEPQAILPPPTAELPFEGEALLPKHNSFISPPLSPSDVVKKILPPGEEAQQAPEGKEAGDGFSRDREHDNFRKPSIFDPVNFSQNLHLHDYKYNLEGRFGFVAGPKRSSGAKGGKESLVKSSIPNIGLPKPRRKLTGSSSSAAAMAGAADAVKSPVAVSDKAQRKQHGEDHSVEKLEQGFIDESDHDTSSSSSSEQEYQESEYGLGPKRKRPLEDDGDDAATSSLQRLAFSSVADETDIDEPLPITCKALEADANDSSLRGYSMAQQLEATPSSLFTKKNFIGVAQVFADQITWGIHKIPIDELLLDDNYEEIPASTLLDERVSRALSKICVDAERCDLAMYASVQDLLPEMPMIGRAHIRPNIRRTVTGQGEPGSSCSVKKNVFSIPPPPVRLFRQDTPIELLSSALPFWEIFGLGPASGPKDVLSYCIFPPGDGIEGAVDTFLTRLGTAYESCKLGSHEKGIEFQGNGPGLVPISAYDHKATSGSGGTKDLEVTCRKFGSFLPNATEDVGNNIVIYMVNNSRHPSAVLNLCAAAYMLFQAYLQSLQAQQKKTFNELVLQIIPMDFIASPTALIVPTQTEYAKVALEVYNRCAPKATKNKRLGPTQHAPSIVLADKPPKAIEFRLTTEPSPSLLMENTCMHMAYSISSDGRWVSAAWTDSFGKYQTNVSYCLARRKGPARPLSEVISEMWETTLQIVQTKRVTWRFILVKDGLMDREEMELWTSLAAQPSQPPFHLTLFDTDSCPDLFIRPPPPAPIPPAYTSSASCFSAATTQPTNIYTTPASTPQNSMLSPDHFGNTVGTPATPSTSAGAGTAASDAPPNAAAAAAAASSATTAVTDVEPDATLVDATDESWGVMLSHRLNNSRSLIDYNPAIASAYLLRRTSVDESQPLDALAINLLYISQPVRGGNDCLMREILCTYRGLGVLARHKSMFKPGEKILPWHLATAAKAQRALSSLL